MAALSKALALQWLTAKVGQFSHAASGFTTAGLPPPTDIEADRLCAVKECHLLT